MASKRFNAKTATNNNNLKERKMKEIKSKTLAEGEHTGHAHQVTVKVMERLDGIREFNGATVVTHEEHNPIELVNKQWASGRKKEYDYIQDMERRVVD